MQANLVNFIQVLRTHDVRVSPAETLDAMDVARTLGYGSRTRLRDGLAMALAKTPAEEQVFSRCFDRYFSQSLADFSLPPAADEVADETASEAGETNVGEPSDGSADDSPGELEAAAEQSPALAELLQ